MEIDYTKLTRDYRQNPIQQTEQLIYEDVYYLYWELNLTKQQVAKILGCSDGRIYKFAKQNNLIKTQQMITQSQKNLMIEKYGTDNIMKTDYGKQKLSESMQKSYETKKKNNSFHISKPEQEIYEKLCQKFKSVKRQYKCERYPFCCDFYIEDIDLFIEFQGTWTHGGEPFCENTCKEQLLEWKEKAKFSEFYEAAIETWTVRDVEKRKWAKEHNLNWIEFFTFEEFLNWYGKD